MIRPSLRALDIIYARHDHEPAPAPSNFSLCHHPLTADMALSLSFLQDLISRHHAVQFLMSPIAILKIESGLLREEEQVEQLLLISQP